jgi:hypothetical protein
MKRLRLDAEVTTNAATAFGKGATACNSQRCRPDQTTQGGCAVVSRIAVFRPHNLHELVIGQTVQQVDLHAQAQDSFAVQGAPHR